VVPMARAWMGGEGVKRGRDSVGKRGGVRMGTSTWRREKEGSAWAHPRCRANRGGQGPWATRANAAGERDQGKAGPGGSGRGAREKERE
jgi:hypothetical protein